MSHWDSGTSALAWKTLATEFTDRSTLSNQGAFSIGPRVVYPGQLLQLIDNCKTVAMETQMK